MANENKFGKISQVKLVTELREGKTVLKDVAFTAPFKIMQPFYLSDDYMQVMVLTASAGIMEGDVQNFDIHVGKGSKLEYLSQAYEKIHRMKEGSAKRTTKIVLEEDSFLKYAPLPTIPFKDSAFENQISVKLKDHTSQMIFQEILSAGRVACGEAFGYRYYHNHVEVEKAGELIYLDNTRFDPELFAMAGLGMYEGFTHLLNLVFFNIEKTGDWVSQVREIIDETPDMEGGVTRIASGDAMVRILGKGSEPLLKISERIQQLA